MSENSCCNQKMERFRWLHFEQPRSNYHFHLISNLFSAKFCRTFEITSLILELQIPESKTLFSLHLSMKQKNVIRISVRFRTPLSASGTQIITKNFAGMSFAKISPEQQRLNLDGFLFRMESGNLKRPESVISTDFRALLINISDIRGLYLAVL